MAADQAIDLDDETLDALMAELSELTADAVEPPKAVTTPASTPDDDLDALAAELDGLDGLDELGALAAELDGVDEVAVKETPPTPEPEPEPEPEPTPKSKPRTKAPAAPAAPAAVALSSVQEQSDPDIVTSSPNATNGLRFFLDPAKSQKDMTVTELNLDEVMMTQASLRTFYGVMHANAEAQAARVKRRVEVQEAQLYDKHRKLALADTSVKVTEKAVENAVRLDPDYLRIHNILIEAESIVAINRATVEGIKDRRDMAIQLGADRRDENKGALRTMARTEEENLSKRGLELARRAN